MDTTRTSKPSNGLTTKSRTTKNVRDLRMRYWLRRQDPSLRYTTLYKIPYGKCNLLGALTT